MRLALMIEGQEDVTWEDWVALAEACERSGVEAMFRSDHYLSVSEAFDRGALDAWATINALAVRTSTLRLGTLLSPVTFRHPSVLGKLVTTADQISGGRIELGLGAGWSQVEHDDFGFALPPIGERMEMLKEQLQIIHGHWGDGAFAFDGRHYRMQAVNALPKPVQQPRPPVIMGGMAGPRSLRLATRYADEYNILMSSPAEAAERRGKLDQVCRDAGRKPMPMSMMTTTVIGADEPEFRRRVGELGAWQGQALDPDALPEAWIAGPLERVIARLREYEQAGVERVFMQHLHHRDREMVELIGSELAPAVA